MEKLNILFYGDGKVDDDDSLGGLSWSINNVREFVIARLQGVADVEIKFIHRHKRDRNTQDEGANKLTWQLLSRFHELWIFGHRQVNIAGDEISMAQPYSQLDAHEIAVLKKWMETGGVMVTGDHSERDPNLKNVDSVCLEDHSKFIGRGAAVGRDIPRAGKLRVWDGPPTNCANDPFDNYNTVEAIDRSKLDTDLSLEFDNMPQTLVNPSITHKLFTYVNQNGEVVPIDVFPDHPHEGKLIELTRDQLDADKDWPPGSPLPLVVAKGKDKRQITGEREYKLVIAFDGDPVKVGRIVADSSFHHYINVNLNFIEARESNGLPKPGTSLDQIAHYYSNLALWLAPKSIREQIRLGLFSRLATHPLVMDNKGMSLQKLGAATRVAAEFSVGISNLYQILAPDDIPQALSTIHNLFGFIGLTDSEDDSVSGTAEIGNAAGVALNMASQTSSDIVLGSIVKGFHDFFSAHGNSSGEAVNVVPSAADIVAAGIKRAIAS